MAEQLRSVKIGEKDGHLMTTFQPPIHDSKLMEATTSAFSIEEILRDRSNGRKIRGVMYGVGNPENFEKNLAKMRAEIETNTSYLVADEVIKLGSTATGAATQTR